jgi:hypothetical protein
MIGRVAKRKSHTAVEVQEVQQPAPLDRQAPDIVTTFNGTEVTRLSPTDTGLAQFMALIGASEEPAQPAAHHFEFSSSTIPVSTAHTDAQTDLQYTTNSALLSNNRSLDGLHWGDQGMTGAEFDFDTFLTNLGLTQP